MFKIQISEQSIQSVGPICVVKITQTTVDIIYRDFPVYNMAAARHLGFVGRILERPTACNTVIKLKQLQCRTRCRGTAAVAVAAAADAWLQAEM